MPASTKRSPTQNQSAQHPEPVYLLVGPEEGEKRDFIRKTIEEYQKKSGEEAERHRFYAGQTEANEIISLLKNGSLFATYKFVTLSGIESLKQQEAKYLAEYVKNPEETATLFLVTEEYRVPKSLENAVPKQRKKIFFELFEDRKRDWLIRYFRSADIAVEEDAVEVLLELVENNTLEMKIAADRLILFFGENEIISADEVEEFIYHSKEENVFTLFAELMDRNFSSSLEILRKILLSGSSSEVQILGGLLWQFRRLLNLSLLMDRHYSREEALRETGIRGKKNQQNYVRGSNSFSTTELKRAISLIAEYDGLVRRSPGDAAPLLLDIFLYRLTHSLA